MSNPISTYYSELNEKYMYAPGYATYGITGKPGNDGKDGSAVYYSNIPFTQTYASEIISRIYNNELLTLSNIHEKNSKKYVKGDIFISPNGNFWQLLVDIDSFDLENFNVLISQYFKKIGKLDLSIIDEFNNSDGPLYLTTSETKEENTLKLYNFYTKGVNFYNSVLNANPEDLNIDENYIVNIINNNISNNYKSELLSLLSVNQTNDSFNKNNLDIYYSELDNAFHISSNKPIIFDSSSLRFSPSADSDNSNNYNSYYQLNTEQDSMTRFYRQWKNCKWFKNDENEIMIEIDKENVEYGSAQNILYKVVLYDQQNKTYSEIFNERASWAEGFLAAVESIETGLTIPDGTSVKSVSIIKGIEVFLEKRE